ncbi:Uncharacterised protein [Vibrio cholerae]|nr:Uncharacterised protein [Vibrio cholerae]
MPTKPAKIPTSNDKNKTEKGVLSFERNWLITSLGILASKLILNVSLVDIRMTPIDELGEKMCRNYTLHKVQL